jgi:hypothetical protein
MQLRFRFRKVIERLFWTGTIKVAYSAKPVEIPHYTDESPATDGVQEWAWQVVDIQRPADCETNVIGMAMAQAELELEENFEEQVHHWCQQDFARRESRRNRK